jgi:hypothetical protein
MVGEYRAGVVVGYMNKQVAQRGAEGASGMRECMYKQIEPLDSAGRDG